MKQILIGSFMLFLLAACSKTEEGFLGEWEGTVERFNTAGDLVEVQTSCEIKSLTGLDHNIHLTIGGSNYDFVARQDLNVLVYKDHPLNSDSIIINYISGEVEMIGDTAIYFDHQIYALKNGALLNSEWQELEMKRN